MPLAIRHISDQTLRLTKLFTDDLYNINIFHLIVSANVVNLSHTSFVDDKVNGLAVVFHVEPVADILAFPYTGRGLSFSALAIISGISFSGK